MTVFEFMALGAMFGYWGQRCENFGATLTGGVCCLAAVVKILF